MKSWLDVTVAPQSEHDGGIGHAITTMVVPMSKLLDVNGLGWSGWYIDMFCIFISSHQVFCFFNWCGNFAPGLWCAGPRGSSLASPVDCFLPSTLKISPWLGFLSLEEQSRLNLPFKAEAIPGFWGLIPWFCSKIMRGQASHSLVSET